MAGRRIESSANDTAVNGPSLELESRLKQQAVIADLGMKALSGLSLSSLLSLASEKLATTLSAEFVSALEMGPPEGGFIYRGGFGWPVAASGERSVDLGRFTPAGMTLSTESPLVITDLASDPRFNKDSPLFRLGISSSITVAIPAPRGKWGVLSVLDRSPRSFGEHDLHFVQAIANVIGSAAERQRAAEIQAHLAAIVESSYDAIFRKDMDGVITTWNAAAARMYGYSATEAIGTRVDKLLFPPELRHTLPEIMSAVRELGSIRLPDTVRVHKDGHRVPISLTVSAIRDSSGKVVAASTIAHDISERKQAEEKLRAAYEELEDKVAERTRDLSDAVKELESFAYAVSHDLRAPLRGIDGFARALREDYGEKLDERGHHYLGRIVRASDKMAHLIDDLLNLSRISHGPLRVEPVDLSDLFRTYMDELAERDPDRVVELIAPNELVVQGDRHLLGIALANLLDNAWKYTKVRQRARIELGQAAKVNGETSYFIADNGIGFDMRYSNKLFVPFQRLHGNEVEGTGIGLATVQRVVRRHGGRLWARSKEDEGSTFFVTLAEPSKISRRKGRDAA